MIPWVLQGITATNVFQMTVPRAEVRPYLTKAHDEAHARRLVRCWAEHEQEFLGCLCQELSAFLRTHLKSEVDKFRKQKVISRVAAFLTMLFTDTELSMVEHKQGLNGKRLWRGVIEAMAREACAHITLSDLDAGWQEECLLSNIASLVRVCGPGYCPDDREGRLLTEVVRQMSQNRMEAKEKILKDAAEASVKRAPWEVTASKRVRVDDD
jgi:hypothetical protein